MSPATFGAKSLVHRGCKGHLEGGGGTKASLCLAGGWNYLVQEPWPGAEEGTGQRGLDRAGDRKVLPQTSGSK